jgi:selenocysteine lyase/cysteine desulfurase
MQPKLDLDFVRGQFPGLSKGWAFFDNAGGSQITANALARITEFLTERNAQIGGSYDVSQAAQEALAAARLAGQTMVNAARPEEIVFGASTTALIQNLARAMRSQLKPGDEIIVTSFDHESNIGPWCLLSEFGIRIKVWGVRPCDAPARPIGSRATAVGAHPSRLCHPYIEHSR